jgi:DNA-binding transcriptional ArsR family regulator
VSITTVRISPPKPPKSRKARKTAPTPMQELERFFRTYRVGLIPFGIALWLALTVAIIAKNPNSYLYIVGTLVVAEVLFWYKGHMIGAIRPIERRYAFAVPALAALWALYATWGHTSVSLHSLGVLVCLTVLIASPWWRHRRVRESVVVAFEDLPRKIRDTRLKETKRLTTGWTAYVSAGHIQGARLKGITFNRWSVGVHVRLRNGAHAAELQRPSRRAHLESASYWPVGPGSVRIQGDDTDSRNCTIRYMLKDPHASPIIPDETESPTIENLIIGLFETGAEVMFALVNTLIAGETGAGKSGIVNRLVQVFSKIPSIGILGVDLTPGATELGPWRHVMHSLASTGDEVSKLFLAVLAECDRRGRIMEQYGWKNFRCTVEDPFMVLIIDEAARVKELRLNKELKLIASIIRKYGGAVIVATQYPKNTSLDSDITINLPQKIGLKVYTETADRVIFGGSATRLGWSPSVLIPDGREGSFLIKSKHYSKPVLARACYVDEDMVRREVDTWSPQRTAIPTINLRAMPTIEREQLEPGTVMTMTEEENSDIVEAVVIDDTEALILDMIEREVNTPTMIRRELESFRITVTVRTVNRHLKSLADRDLIVQLRKQGPWFRKH